MIVDDITNPFSYGALGDRIVAAMDFLRRDDLATLPIGRHPLDGEDVFAIISRYVTRDESEAVWEAHRRYIDVHFVIDGAEQVTFAPAESMTVTVPYDSATDSVLFRGSGDTLMLQGSRFALFYPQDAHRPGICLDEGPRSVLKVVVKAAV